MAPSPGQPILLVSRSKLPAYFVAVCIFVHCVVELCKAVWMRDYKVYGSEGMSQGAPVSASLVLPSFPSTSITSHSHSLSSYLLSLKDLFERNEMAGPRSAASHLREMSGNCKMFYLGCQNLSCYSGHTQIFPV